jgi:hypothetical protein
MLCVGIGGAAAAGATTSTAGGPCGGTVAANACAHTYTYIHTHNFLFSKEKAVSVLPVEWLWWAGV